MKEQVTVIPSDSLIIVDGEAVFLSFTSSPGVHAIQWEGTGGHTEYTDRRLNTPLTTDDYATHVQPFVTLWETEKARIKELRERQPSLEDARTERLTLLTKKTRERILAGFSHTIDGQDYHFSYDDEDQSNFSKANSAALFAVIAGDTAFRQVWRGWQGDTPTIFTLTAQEYVALAQAGGEHQLWYQRQAWEKEAALMAASSFTELNAIII